MNRLPSWDEIIEFVRAWPRKSAHVSFSSLLVVVGASVAFPSIIWWIVWVVVELATSGRNPIQDPSDPGLWGVVGGLGLIAVGLGVYFAGPKTLTIKDGFRIQLQGGTFEQAAQIIASSSGRVVRFVGFTDSELDAEVRAEMIESSDRRVALERLRLVVVSRPFANYSVAAGDGEFVLEVLNEQSDRDNAQASGRPSDLRARPDTHH